MSALEGPQAEDAGRGGPRRPQEGGRRQLRRLLGGLQTLAQVPKRGRVPLAEALAGQDADLLDTEEERRVLWAQLEANDDATQEPLRDVGAREGRGGVGDDDEPGGEDARVDLQKSRWRSPSGTMGSGGPGVGA